MKHLLIIYSLVFLILLGKASHGAQDNVDFNALVPAAEVAAELGQNATEEEQSEPILTNPNLRKDPDGESDKGFLFHRHYPWIYPYPAPYPYYPVYSPYYYPAPYRAPLVTCFASDAFGTTWSAVSYNAFEAQNMAMNQCFAYSNRGCYSRGCNY